MKKPVRRKAEAQAAARRYLRQHWSEIALHTLYLRWGLPTALLRKKRT